RVWDKIAPMTDWNPYVQDLGQKARKASRQLVTLSGERRGRALRAMAALLRQRADALIAANGRDLAAAETGGLAPSLISRLKLDPARVAKMADSVAEIAEQVDPVGQVIEGFNRPNG